MSDYYAQNVLQEINESIPCNEQQNAKLPKIKNLKIRIVKELIKKDGLFELLFKKFYTHRTQEASVISCSAVAGTMILTSM